jgi:hypothetical protein
MGQNSDRTKSGNIVMLKPLKMDISNNGVVVARPGKGANMATAMGGQLLRKQTFSELLWIRILNFLPVRIRNNHSRSGSKIKWNEKCPHRHSIKLNI